MEVSTELFEPLEINQGAVTAAIVGKKKRVKKQAAEKPTGPKIPKQWRDLNAHIEANNGLVPNETNPLCIKCGLNTCGALKPYMPYSGSENPSLAIVLGEVSKKEDYLGEMGADGPARLIWRQIQKLNEEVGADLSRVRFISATMCANINAARKTETGAKHCSHFMVADLMTHPPQLIMPVGTAALKLLSHKSDAGNWAGRTLTWRGWPDHWLTDAKFEIEHPVFGPRPGVESRIPMVPIQSPRLVFLMKNPRVIKKWNDDMLKALRALKNGVKPLVYDRVWWTITEDPQYVLNVLKHLLNLASKGHKLILTFDTETNGLKPWKTGAVIVFMMLRWNDPEKGPVAVGWPWEYETSALNEHRAELGPLMMQVLCAHLLQGHNLTFDVLFSLANIVPNGVEWIDRLCEAMHRDTWHMAYTARASKGSLGLELLAYDHAPEFAGYEEEFELLKDRTPEMDPRTGGHYAMCPRDKWDTHLRPYVLGDVEVCHVAGESLESKLLGLPLYKIPISNPESLGKFRYYTPMSRHNIYYNILSPAASVLTKMMARGMYVNPETVQDQELLFPKLINEAKNSIRKSSQRIDQWCSMQEANSPDWMVDLENKTILKTILFDLMGLPIKNLTDAGLVKFKNTPLDQIPRDEAFKYASTSKFTLSNLAVEHESVRDVISYRSLHKQYTAFVRPMRNIVTEGIDKNEREKDQYMQRDGLVHSTFKIATTTTGRLSSCLDGDQPVEYYENGVLKLVRVKDLVLEPHKRKYVVSHTGNLREITSKIFKQKAEMVEITTSLGTVITCTTGHRLLTDNGWAQVGKLSFNSKLVRALDQLDCLPELESEINESNELGATKEWLEASCGLSKEWDWYSCRKLRQVCAGGEPTFSAAMPQLFAIQKMAGPTTVDIVSIKPIGVRAVYDIEIDIDHSYCAGGVIHHNSEPNLQQLPRESLVKAMYQSRFGNLGCIYQADKSQIELRLLAAASGDPAMVNAYRNDIDLHSQTTSLLFNIPYDNFSDDYTEWLQKNNKSKEAKELKTKRKVGKTANFLTGYGGGARGLQTSLASNGLYYSEDECQRILDTFFGNYSTLQRHIGVYKSFIQEKGCAVSLFGRIRPLEEAFSEDKGISSKALRNGYNHLIQSSASDMMLLALVAIEQLMRDSNLKSILVSTVHDSLVVDALISELDAVHDICTSVMDNMPLVISSLIGPSYDLSWAHILPFECDAEVGRDYLNAKSVPKSGLVDWNQLLALN